MQPHASFDKKIQIVCVHKVFWVAEPSQVASPVARRLVDETCCIAAISHCIVCPDC